jgi:hypothetical protein
MDLQEMTSDELNTLQIKWYEDAKDSGKLTELHAIGRYLGTPLQANYGPKYAYNVDELYIYVDDYGHYMTVNYKEKMVCSTHPCERLYVPGDWETMIPQLVNLADQRKKDRFIEVEEKRKSELLKKLQL